MRFIIGFLSGVLGMLAGWSGLALLVVTLAGSERDDGGTAMGAFFNIGPIGGVIGFAAGVFLFVKLGMSRTDSAATPLGASSDASLPDAEPSVAVSSATPAVVSPPARTRVSPVFAVAIVAITAGLAWWGWYELIRSPYLSHGYMTLELQFRLPAGMALPGDAADIHITLEEGQHSSDVTLGRAWHGTDGNRRVILASKSLSDKASRRVVSLAIPGVPEQSWKLDLSSDLGADH